MKEAPVQRSRETSAHILMWIVPLLIVGTYLIAAWQLFRWNEDELLFVLGTALVAGFTGICMLPIALWQKACSAGVYLPLMGFFLFMASFHGLGCGVFGHCL